MERFQMKTHPFFSLWCFHGCIWIWQPMRCCLGEQAAAYLLVTKHVALLLELNKCVCHPIVKCQQHRPPKKCMFLQRLDLTVSPSQTFVEEMPFKSLLCLRVYNSSWSWDSLSYRCRQDRGHTWMTTVTDTEAVTANHLCCRICWKRIA